VAFDLPIDLSNYGIGGIGAPPAPPGIPAPAAPPGLPPGLVLPPGVTAAPILPPPPEPTAPPPVDAITGAAPAAEPGPDAPAAAPAPPPIATGDAARDQAFSEQAGTLAGLGEVRSRELAATGGLLSQRNDAVDTIAAQAKEQQAKDDAWLQTLTTRYDQAITDEANHEIDQGRRFKSMKTGQKVLLGVGAILSGLGQALDSARLGGPKVGPNPVIEMMTREMEKDVQIQQQEGEAKARRAGMAGQAMDRFSQISKDRQVAFNLRMSAEMERTARQIEAAAAGYDSEEAVLNAQGAVAELRQKGLDYRDAAISSAWNRQMEERKFGEQVAGRRQQASQFNRSLAQSDDHFKASLAEKAKERDLDIKRLEAAGQLEAAKALREAKKREEELTIPNVFTEDGSPVTARTVEEARDLRKQQGPVNSAIALIDETKRIIAKSGGSAKSLKGDEYQKVTSNVATIKNMLRTAYEMGALDKGALEQMNSMMGGADPTSFIYDARAGLDQVRSQLERGYTDKLRAQQPNASAFKPFSTSAGGAPAETPLDEALGRLTDTKTPIEAGNAERKTAAGQAVESALLFRGAGEPLNSEKAALAAEGAPFAEKSTDQASKDLKLLVETTLGGGEGAKRARENLLQAAKAKPEVAGAALRAIAETGDVALFDEVAKQAASTPGAELYVRQLRDNLRIDAQTNRISQLGEAAAGGDLAAAQALLDLTQAPDPAVSKAAIGAVVELQRKIRPKEKAAK
jgi:hypothetical protein